MQLRPAIAAGCLLLLAAAAAAAVDARSDSLSVAVAG